MYELLEYYVTRQEKSINAGFSPVSCLALELHVHVYKRVSGECVRSIVCLAQNMIEGRDQKRE